MDGDGYSDVLVAEADTSQVHLFYGPLSGSTDAAAADLVLFGTGGTGFGYRVSLLGDTSGDGIGDLAVTSTAYDGATGNEGAVHVLHGGWMGDVDLAADYALRLQGDAGDDALGESLGERGDLDGDGLMEIIVGSALNDDAGVSAGKVYVIAGDGSTGERDVGTGALATMTGAAAGDTFGTSVTGGFDYDADGYEDLAVGAPLYDSAFEADAGGAFVFLGPVSGDVSAASAYAIWYGEGLQDKLGASVDGGGDPNLDGNEDLLVGGISYNGGSYDKGVVYVVFGPTGGVMGLVDAQAKLEGESWTGYAGSSVAWLSDWDGDLQDEAIIGSNGYASTTSKQGRVYVVDGASIFH